MRVGIFGGSFNPPHAAHVLAVAYVLACSELDRVVVVPAFQHPFAKSLASFEDRLEMCRRAFEPYSRGRVEISAVEEELGGESRTVRTLEHLHAMNPDWQMRLIVGADIVHEMDRWWSPERVRELAPPIVLGRIGVAPAMGHENAPRVLPEVSSTAIRAALSAGESLNAMVPRTVLDWIGERGLYRS
jgi:nicotinate-nucleotide adenylyltransferase